jgi:hypothetical protein
MTDRELEALLRDAQPPAWPPEHWETFPTQVVQRLQESGSRIGVRKPRHFVPAGFVWIGLAAAACVVLVFWRGPWHRGEVLDPMPVTASVRLVSELTELFPNALRAVIIEGGIPGLCYQNSLAPGAPSRC